jgi:2-polyprenyl-3-methyl-5-hydroxy-6-metoxy-1,4-benzoquinol methylase
MLTWLSGTKRSIRCRVCGSEELLSEVVAAPHLAFPEVAATFVKCASCESISYVDDILAFEHIQDGDLQVFLRQYLESTAGIWEMLWPVAVLDRPADKSFLDVGCGFGFTADAWRSVFNAEAYGCDPAAYAQAGRNLLGPHIFHALLDDVPDLANKNFDIVYASEVIEHVPDPTAFVELLASRVASNGVIVLTTPAADFIEERNDPSTTEAALAPGFHGFLFSRAALESLLKATGFSYVIVERHGERLLAWASNAPIVKNDSQSVLEHYHEYLRRGAFTSIQNPNQEQLALRSGFAYRLYKESVLRGKHQNLAALRALAIASLRIDNRTESQTIDPNELAQTLATLAVGPAAFGAHFRFNLPQIALLAGFHAESLDRDVNAARAWFELALLATERLCAPSVLHGLEAAAFYWHADARLMQYDLLASNTRNACARLARAILALNTPYSPIGGSAPSPEHVVSLIEMLVRTPLANNRGEVLREIENFFAIEAKSQLPAAATYLFVSKYIAAHAAHGTTSEKLSHSLTDLSAAANQIVDRTLRMRELAKNAVNELAQTLKPDSFAALSSSKAYTAPGGGRWR